MRDLNVICGPRADQPAGAITAEIASQTGIGLLTYGPGPGAVELAIPSHAAAKAKAIAAHTTIGRPSAETDMV